MQDINCKILQRDEKFETENDQLKSLFDDAEKKLEQEKRKLAQSNMSSYQTEKENRTRLSSTRNPMPADVTIEEIRSEIVNEKAESQLQQMSLNQLQMHFDEEASIISQKIEQAANERINAVNDQVSQASRRSISNRVLSNKSHQSKIAGSIDK